MALVTDIAKYVRLEVMGCPEILINDAILRAVKEMSKKTKAIKQSVDIVTSPDVQDYAIPTATDTVPDEILAVNRDVFTKLTASTHKEFEDNALNTSSGTPMFYYMSGGRIFLGYIPNAVETLEVVVKIRPTENATTIPDELVDRYKDQIASGAKAILMKMKDKAWTDVQMAAMNQNDFEQAIADINWRDARGESRKPMRTTSHQF